ncbi:MAG: aryl-sulfate sulfotransferase [Bacteroidales bacterium]|nr:aryl-sulfate sulfotransferase [Bacteroidales bacterium]
MKLSFIHSPSVKVFTLIFTLLFSINLKGQAQVSDYFPNIKILESNNPAPGYYFLAAKGVSAENASLYISIVDNFGTPVFFRKMNKASGSMRLMKDGRIGYLNGVPRKLFILDEMLEVESKFAINGFNANGHDWAFDKEGNILLMGEAVSYKNMSGLIEGGNENAEVLDVVIQEFDKEGTLKYTWNSADHFDIFDGNENSDYLDYTEAQLDYVHANSVAIDSDTSFILSCRHMDEITKVDRRTGEIIWRLGGKNNQFTFINDPIGFSHQHSISRLDNGNLLVFDNGNLHDTQESSSIIYDLDENNMTATLIHRYGRETPVYSNHGSGTQEVYNGNVINYWGVYWPSATEFHPDGTVALEMDFTQHSFSPRILKYTWETKVFETDIDSIDFEQIEEQSAIQKTVFVTNNKAEDLVLTSFSSHSNLFGITDLFPITIGAGQSIDLHIQFNGQLADKGLYNDVITLSADTEEERIARQIWVFAEKMNNLTAISNLDSKNSSFTLAPIPAKGILELQFNFKDEKVFELFNLNGQSLYRSQVFTQNSLDFDISRFRNGVYFIVLTNNKTNLTEVQKFIIQN